MMKYRKQITLYVGSDILKDRKTIKQLKGNRIQWGGAKH